MFLLANHDFSECFKNMVFRSDEFKQAFQTTVVTLDNIKL